MWKLHSYHFFICVYLFWFSEIKFCNHSSSSTIMCSLSTEPRCTVSTIVLKNSVFFDKCFSMWAMYHTFQWMYFCNCILPLCNVFEILFNIVSCFGQQHDQKSQLSSPLCSPYLLWSRRHRYAASSVTNKHKYMAFYRLFKFTSNILFWRYSGLRAGGWSALSS